MREENQALRETVAELKGAVDSLRVASAPLAAEPTEQPLPSDEELEAAFAEGRGAAKFKQVVDKAVSSATRRLKETEIDPLRNSGALALKELAGATLKDERYYKRYKKEIDAIANTLPVENLGNPQTWRYVYQAVVGGHADEIAKEAAEAALRQQRSDVGDGGAPGGTGRVPETPSPSSPSVKDVAGSEGEAALAYAKKDADEMVKRMRIPGVNNWAEYVAMGERLEAENG
jgi:hypothetical protein